MAHEAPGLRNDGTVYCVGCGVVHETATALVADNQAAIQSLGQIIGQKDAKIGRIEAGQVSKLERSRKYPDAIRVLDHWHRACSPKAREPHSEPRVKLVIDRLGKPPAGFTVDELKRAADGYARRPYIVDNRRVSKGHSSQRHCDATFIYREASTVEKGLAMADQPPELPGKYDWRQVRRNNHAQIMRNLPDAVRDPATGIAAATCPQCKGRLEVCDPSRAQFSLLRCRGCRINETTFLAALRDDLTAFDPRVLNALEEIAYGLDHLDIPEGDTCTTTTTTG